MTVRNKALGRAKGPFAATTYIRGDVINFGGALYAAKESFTATSTFNINDWDEVLAAPSSAFVKATIGPGLPSLADRTNGDLHYDTQARKLFAHIGVAGGVIYSDNFDRPDGPVVTGNGYSSTPGVWEGFAANIIGNRFRFQSGSGYFGYLAMDTGGANNDLSVNVTFTTQSDGSYGGEFQLGLESKGNEGMGNITAPYYLKMYLANGATSASFHVYGPSGKVKADGTYVTGTAQQISDYVTGTVSGIQAGRPVTIPVRFSVDVNGRLRAWINGNLVYDAVVEIALPQNRGTHVMLTGSAYYFNGVYYDDFIAGALGTLEWAESKIDAANINFTPIGNLSATDVKAALNELDMEKAPLSHAHTGRGGDSALNTLGAGLPSLSGRKNGDLHLDTDTGRAYIHSGSGPSGAGAFVDTFDRANAASLGSAPNGNAYEYPLAQNWAIVGGKASVPLSNASMVVLNVGAGNGFFSFLNEIPSSLRLLFRYTDVNNYWMYEEGQLYKKQAGSFTAIGAPSGTYGTAASKVGKTLGLDFSGDTIRFYIDGVLNHTMVSADTFNRTATRIGLHHNVNGHSDARYIDDLTYGSSVGTLAWVSAEPIYLQAHLVSGNVVVANHVLKPGVRVPSACALKEVVLRCETAPVGASLTVTVERFNGGVNQGVIATVSIPTGENVGSTVGLSAACAKGDILKFNVTSVGSTTAGADLTASLDLR